MSFKVGDWVCHTDDDPPIYVQIEGWQEGEFPYKAKFGDDEADWYSGCHLAKIEVGDCVEYIGDADLYIGKKGTIKGITFKCINIEFDDKAGLPTYLFSAFHPNIRKLSKEENETYLAERKAEEKIEKIKLREKQAKQLEKELKAEIVKLKEELEMQNRQKQFDEHMKKVVEMTELIKELTEGKDSSGPG